VEGTHPECGACAAGKPVAFPKGLIGGRGVSSLGGGFGTLLNAFWVGGGAATPAESGAGAAGLLMFLNMPTANFIWKVALALVSSA